MEIYFIIFATSTCLTSKRFLGISSYLKIFSVPIKERKLYFCCHIIKKKYGVKRSMIKICYDDMLYAGKLAGKLPV